MNGAKSVLTVLILGGLALALTRNMATLPAVIGSGSRAFSLIYRTVSGTDYEQRRAA